MISSLKKYYSLLTCGLLVLLILSARLIFPFPEEHPALLIWMIHLLLTAAGIWFLRKVLLTFFTEAATSLTLIAVILGTNYLQAVTSATPGSPVYMLALYPLILWFTIRWHDNPGWRHSIPLAIGIGIAILVYPFNVISLFIPILWNVSGHESFKQKWIMIKGNRIQVIAMLMIILVMLTPWAFYWDFFSATFHYEGYSPKAVYHFLREAWPVLFSFHSGWLIYSPLVIFSLAGWYFLAEENRTIFYPGFLFVTAYYILVSGWPVMVHDNWLGNPNMIPVYAVLALPIGYLIKQVTGKGLMVRIPFFILVFLVIGLNLFQTWQFSKTIIQPSRMTREYYGAIFGRVEVPPGAYHLRLKSKNPEADFFAGAEGMNRRIIFVKDFEDPLSSSDFHVVPGVSFTGSRSYCLDTTKRFSPGYRASLSGFTKSPRIGIRFTVHVLSHLPFNKNPGSLVVTLNHDSKLYKYMAVPFSDFRQVNDQWTTLSTDFAVPGIGDFKDILQAYVWYLGKDKIWIDDLTIELFEEKD